jgi:lipopolysaccharide biosynthesis glycosyltransferase
LPSCCIAYTTDPAYLFPTLVSAAQARHHASAEKADVVIFGFGLNRATELIFSKICKSEGVVLERVELGVLRGGSAMMSRLFLCDFAPAAYKQYLYLDGDVQIVDSLDPLLDAEVPPGRFMAANDPLTFQIDDNTALSRRLLSHLVDLGLTHTQARSYFNSGVLRINRAGWDEIGARAWELFSNKGGTAKFPDQDVLNLVGREQRIPMSLGWNFPMFFRNSRLGTDIRPRILHFMSNPKPWQGNFPPWTQQACSPYLEMIRRYPVLASFNSTMPRHKSAYYHIQQRRKRVSELMMWGFTARRTRILDYELACSGSCLSRLPDLGSLINPVAS